jgi:hypothetical protein
MMPKRGSMEKMGHKQPEDREVGTFLRCLGNLLIKLILVLESDPIYNPSEHDEMITDSSTFPTRTILGMSSSSNQPRLRYSYPVSAVEWTEYTSPLMHHKVNFYIDSTGDRSQPMSMSHHQLLFYRNYMCYSAADASETRISNTISSCDTTSNIVSATGQNTGERNDIPSNDIILSPEQKHVLDLVRAGKK